MTKRVLRIALGLLWLFASCTPGEVEVVRRPNILLITTDQQRHDTVGALDNSVIRTPNLDRLVGEGVASLLEEGVTES